MPHFKSPDPGAYAITTEKRRYPVRGGHFFVAADDPELDVIRRASYTEVEPFELPAEAREVASLAPSVLVGDREFGSYDLGGVSDDDLVAEALKRGMNVSGSSPETEQLAARVAEVLAENERLKASLAAAEAESVDDSEEDGEATDVDDGSEEQPEAASAKPRRSRK